MNQSIHDFFVLELQDLYNAENQILQALPKMIEKASDGKLRDGFKLHFKQTQKHVKRLEDIKKDLDIDLDGKPCVGMKGVIKEGEEMMREMQGTEVLDAALIAAAQKVEHYEISGYGTAAALAKQMGHKKALKLLVETLEEEKKTDKKLSSLAKKKITKKSD